MQIYIIYTKDMIAKGVAGMIMKGPAGMHT